MAVEISFIRHGETTANRDGIWQGHGDSPFTDRGRRQVAQLRDRMAQRSGDRRFGLVVSSDLERAQATAAAVGGAVETDVIWREADIGGWEGLDREQVRARFPDQVAALRSGQKVKLGGGESYDDLVARVDDALAKLLARLDDGDRVAVVTHGGVIGSVGGGVLGIRDRPRPWPVSRLANTSITTVRVDGERHQLAAYNDAAHLKGDHDALGLSGAQFVALIRHGETTSNVAGRWAGITDVPLTEGGRDQARALADAQRRYDVVYSSTLDRARATAGAIAARHGIERRDHSGIGEMSFGEWENLRPDEIIGRWGDEWQSIYRDGHDLPRGRSGETYEAVAGRMAAAVADIARANEGSEVALVSHGGAIRAYLTAQLGIPFAHRHRLAEPANTAVSRVALGQRTSMDGSAQQGTILVDYNVTAHLER